MLNLSDISFITFSVLVQCFFAIVYLSTYRWKRNKWLVLFFAMVFSMQLGVFNGGDDLSIYQRLIMGNPGMLMALVPSLYLFTRELVSINLKGSAVMVHFLPALFFYVLSLLFEDTQPRVLLITFSEGRFPL
ncbi:MAG: hypothetical protein AAF598_17145, partial [Bacteroidota bacterium]